MNINMIKNSNIINFEDKKKKIEDENREMIRNKFVNKTLENLKQCNFTSSEAMLVTTSLVSHIMEIDFRKE